MPDSKYLVLNQLRISRKQPWQDFYREFEKYGVPGSTLYKAATGKTIPNEITAYALDKFISSHESEIRAAIESHSSIEA